MEPGRYSANMSTVTLSILTAVPQVLITEVLLVPVILASLPLSSLLVPGNERVEQPQEATPGAQFEMVSKSKGSDIMSAQLDGGCNVIEYRADFSDRTGREKRRSAANVIDRELHEIDSIK